MWFDARAAAHKNPQRIPGSTPNDDPEDDSASEDEAVPINHGRKGAGPSRLEASDHTASGNTLVATRSDEPGLLAPQTGAEFAAEAKQRKLEKKRRLNPPETQPKPPSQPQANFAGPRGDAAAASNGGADDKEAREHGSNGATSVPAATAMDDAEAEATATTEEAHAAGSATRREGRRAVAQPGDGSPRSSQPTDGHSTRMGDQTTTDSHPHGSLNAHDPTSGHGQLSRKPLLPRFSRPHQTPTPMLHITNTNHLQRFLQTPSKSNAIRQLVHHNTTVLMQPPRARAPTVPSGIATRITARSAPNDAAAAPMSVEGTPPGPRAGAAASDDEAGEDEAGGGGAGVAGQRQRSSTPRELGAEAVEAAAEDMDEALEASAKSAAGAGSRPRPDGWALWTRNQQKNWRAVQKKKQRK